MVALYSSANIRVADAQMVGHADPMAVVNLRLDDAIHDEVRQHAADERRSINSTLNYLVERGLLYDGIVRQSQDQPVVDHAKDASPAPRSRRSSSVTTAPKPKRGVR